MPVRLQFRRGTAAQWESANPVLSQGELGLTYDTGQFKVGDGSTAWNALPYGGLLGPTGPEGQVGLQGVRGLQGTAGGTGPQGNIGPQGVQGFQGPTGVDSTVTGPTGWTGPLGTGPTGPGSTVTGPTGPRGTDGVIGVDGTAGATGPTGGGSTGAGGGVSPILVTEITGTSATLSSANYNSFLYVTNSAFSAMTLPATTATSAGGNYWTLRNATGSTLSITLTNTLSLTSPLVIPPTNAQTLVISGSTSNTILLL